MTTDCLLKLLIKLSLDMRFSFEPSVSVVVKQSNAFTWIPDGNPNIRNCLR